MLLATLLTLLMATISAITLASAARQLTVAKSDAFDSIVVLSQARAVGHDASADEGRYLLDPQRAALIAAVHNGQSAVAPWTAACAGRPVMIVLIHIIDATHIICRVMGAKRAAS